MAEVQQPQGSFVWKYGPAFVLGVAATLCCSTLNERLGSQHKRILRDKSAIYVLETSMLKDGNRQQTEQTNPYLPRLVALEDELTAELPELQDLEWSLVFGELSEGNANIKQKYPKYTGSFDAYREKMNQNYHEMFSKK